MIRMGNWTLMEMEMFLLLPWTLVIILLLMQRLGTWRM
jgi:hypothetical protein